MTGCRLLNVIVRNLKIDVTALTQKIRGPLW